MDTVPGERDGTKATRRDSYPETEPESKASLRERTILSEIQDLKEQLWKLQSGHYEDNAGEAASAQPPAGKAAQSRLIVVSNRLPLSILRDADSGGLAYRMSSGGLVTALNGVKDDMSFLWVGWAGTEIAEEEQDMVLAKIKEDYEDSLRPVFLEEELASLYYNGFSNAVLWPLFHYQPLPSFKKGDEQKFNVESWEAYVRANQMFADVVCKIYRPGDFIWVHDYHLMMLPSILRKRLPDCKLGWFLHVPFPSSEVYRMLPVRKEILEGVLCSDLVGFHTYDYARHFLTACTRILGLECSPKGVEYDGRFCSIGVHPIGIDPDYFVSALQKPKAQNRVQELLQMFKGQRILLGVDRLDYIKGMPHKLLAFELFLQNHPEWVRYVVLVQIAVPSRTDVDEYKVLCSQVNELVGRVNGRYGSLDYTPIHYINRSVKTEELCALYNVADACVVTSVRDGMNLVSYEYICCQNEKSKDRKPGVLILSEFAGSAQSLSGAIRVNPWNTQELADSIYKALSVGAVEKELRQSKLHRYVTTHNAIFWAKSFVQELQDAVKINFHSNNFMSNASDRSSEKRVNIKSLLRAYKNAKSRLIVAGFEGILAPTGTAQDKSSLQFLPQRTKNNLTKIIKEENNLVVVVSSMRKQQMLDVLGRLGCGIAAEHGFHYLLRPLKKGWTTLEPPETLNTEGDWKTVVMPIMSYFAERTPGSVIEQREMSVTWHYRNADQDFGAWQAKDLQVHLEDAVSDYPLEVYQGSKRIEVRHVKASKAMFVERLLTHLGEAQKKIDFVLCLGSSRSDEDMFGVFSALQAEASLVAVEEQESELAHSLASKGMDSKVQTFCCKVGKDIRGAKASFALDSSTQVRELVSIMADLSKKQMRKKV